MATKVTCERMIFLLLTDKLSEKEAGKENPDLPAVDGKNNQDEPPQIKGPVERPDREEEKVVQVDRPDAGKTP